MSYKFRKFEILSSISLLVHHRDLCPLVESRRTLLSSCPPAYWDRPSKHCAQPIVNALQAFDEHLLPLGGASDDAERNYNNNNRTCS